jgi:hypothetical protein
MTRIDCSKQSQKLVVYLKKLIHALETLTQNPTNSFHIHTVSAIHFLSGPYNNALTTLDMGTTLRSDVSSFTDNQQISSELLLKTYKIGHLPPPLEDLYFTTSDRTANDDYTYIRLRLKSFGHLTSNGVTLYVSVLLKTTRCIKMY